LKWLALTLTCLCSLILLTPSAKADNLSGTANLSFPAGTSFQFHDITNNAYIIFNVYSGTLDGSATWTVTNDNGTMTITPGHDGVVIVSSQIGTPEYINRVPLIFFDGVQHDGGICAFSSGVDFTVSWLASPLTAWFKISFFIPFFLRIAAFAIPFLSMVFMYSRIKSARGAVGKTAQGLLAVVVGLMMIIVFYGLWSFAVALDVYV
jgi:hypothetical protein